MLSPLLAAIPRLRRPRGLLGTIALFALLSGTTSCAKGGYTSRAEELKPRLAALRAVDALSAGAKMLGSTDTIPVTPAPMLGSYLEPDTNTLAIDSATLANLGKDRDCEARLRTGKGVDCDEIGASDHFGALCADDAAAVLERGEWAREDNYHSRDLSAQCATYLLRLRYVALVRATKVESDKGVMGPNDHSSFEGSVTLVDLDTKKVIGALPIKARSEATLSSAVHDARTDRDYQVVEKEAKDVNTLAREAITKALVDAFPGTKHVDYIQMIQHPNN